MFFCELQYFRIQLIIKEKNFNIIKNAAIFLILNTMEISIKFNKEITKDLSFKKEKCSQINSYNEMENPFLRS